MPLLLDCGGFNIFAAVSLAVTDNILSRTSSSPFTFTAEEPPTSGGAWWLHINFYTSSGTSVYYEV
jgi:hypothetical protein